MMGHSGEAKWEMCRCDKLRWSATKKPLRQAPMERNKKAQGNALGKKIANTRSPERAKQVAVKPEP
jgi:hypothetical protein